MKAEPATDLLIEACGYDHEPTLSVLVVDVLEASSHEARAVCLVDLLTHLGAAPREAAGRLQTALGALRSDQP